MVIIGYISYVLPTVFVMLVVDVTTYVALEKRKKLINSILEIRRRLITIFIFIFIFTR